MEEYGKELQTLFQKWSYTEKEWATSEELWKEKEHQWLEKELEYFTNTEDPARGKAKKPWENTEKEWEQKECPQMSREEVLRSLEIVIDPPQDVSNYIDLLVYQFQYSEREKHWAHRKSLWLQKEAWYKGREQMVGSKLNSDKSAELKTQLLQEENNKLKASVVEQEARIVASKMKELCSETEQNIWRDSEQGLEKQISKLENQVEELQTELAMKDLLEREVLNEKTKFEAELFVEKENANLKKSLDEVQEKVLASKEKELQIEMEHNWRNLELGLKKALDEKATIEEELKAEVKLRKTMQEACEELENKCLKQKQQWDQEKHLELLKKERLWKQALDEQNKQAETTKERLILEMKINRERWEEIELNYENQLLESAKTLAQTNRELQECMQRIKEQDEIAKDLKKKLQEQEKEWKEKEALLISQKRKLTEEAARTAQLMNNATNGTVHSPLADVEPNKPEKKKQRWGFFARIFRFKQKSKCNNKNSGPC